MSSKRLISLLLAVVLIVSLIPCNTVSAAETQPAVITVEDSHAAAGATVKVNITIKNNPGILAMSLRLNFDESIAKLISVENGEALSDMAFVPPTGDALKSGCLLGWDTESVDPNSVKDGVIATLTYEIAEDATPNRVMSISVTPVGNIVDDDLNPISATTVAGKMRILDYIPGDVNSDGQVTSSDTAFLRRYIAGGYGVTINEDAGDVNADGLLTSVDVAYIRRHIAGGYGVVLKPAVVTCRHSNMEKTAYKAATCTEDGNVEYYYCDDCGLYFNTAAATTELTWEQIVLKSTGHNEVIDKAVPPTYDETGLTEGSHCSVCGKVFVEQEEVPKLQANHHSITYRNLNGADTPQPSSYAEHTGLEELPVPAAPGYTFKGWYTASEGGNIVDYIPAGSTQDYILYARWELVTYTINYFEAPNYEGATTYTVEDEIYLNEPNWPGLGFTGWSEENGKVTTEVKNSKTVYKIAPGTTGNLKLTANWKLMRNIATPGTNRTMLAEYNPETGHYMFIYELGTIENVVLEQMSSSLLYQHTGAGDFTLEMASENTLEESIADSITRTISKSVSSSSEWENSKDWAKENSDEHSTHVDIGLEFGDEQSFVHASIETGYGYAHTSSSSWGGSESKGGSYGEETENGEEVGSSFSYLTSLTTSSLTSVTISADAPKGYYDYVQAGNIRVFGVVTYMPNEDPTKEGQYYLNTYSMLDNMHGVVLYYPTVNDLNNPTCETLQYNIPREDIKAKIDESYFVQYDANGGVGEMHDTLHTVGGTEKLAKNTFTREGYTFMGWETRGYVEGQDEPVSTGTYTDEQIINTALADKGVKVTMYAQWEKADYTIEYEGNKPALGSTYVDYLPSNTACKYDEDVTLGAAPTLAGYTFGGWYYDSTCTRKAGDAGETLVKPNLTNENGGVVKLYAKWTANSYKLKFDTDGGAMEQTEMDVVFDSSFSSTATPVKDGYKFLGWILPDGSELTMPAYWRYAEDVTVTAKWLKTKEVVELRMGYRAENNDDKYVTDDDKVYDFIDPMMDRQTLSDQGYTKLSIKVKIYLYEVHDGNKDFWIRPYFDKTGTDIDSVSFSSTKGQWNEHTFSFDVQNLSDSAFNDACAFWLEYGADGNQGDSWYAGDTWITIEAVK